MLGKKKRGFEERGVRSPFFRASWLCVSAVEAEAPWRVLNFALSSCARLPESVYWTHSGYLLEKCEPLIRGRTTRQIYVTQIRMSSAIGASTPRRQACRRPRRHRRDVSLWRCLESTSLRCRPVADTPVAEAATLRSTSRRASRGMRKSLRYPYDDGTFLTLLRVPQSYLFSAVRARHPS